MENKVWHEFIESLIHDHFGEYKKTKEHEYLHHRKMYLDDLMTNELTKSQKTMIEEIIFEFGSAEERRGDFLYAQGMKDCVMILKNLGVLA